MNNKRHPSINQSHGKIIGTGEADFTKGNTTYVLHHQDKKFCLMDVPGIEGDENKYTHLVQEAVAKAHMIFYVNGTNKKPEATTILKVKNYLRRGTKICPLINVRGSADSYEFEEDRVSLSDHGSAAEGLRQTESVLATALGSDVLINGYCIQGLLAFSALAMEKNSRKSTIHPSRKNDLVVQQRNYLKHFGSPDSMYEFSRIDDVSKLLQEKLSNFKEEIIESNKTKTKRLLIEHVNELKKMQQEHQAFMLKMKAEFKKCHETIDAAAHTFLRQANIDNRNIWLRFFNDMSQSADNIVAQNFGANEIISQKINTAFQNGQTEATHHSAKRIAALAEKLKIDIQQAEERLVQDMYRTDFQQKISVGMTQNQAAYRPASPEMEMGKSGWGGVAFNIGSYTATGAQLGGPIGAALGALAGVAVSILSFFSSKKSRIRKAQAAVQKRLEETKRLVMTDVTESEKSLFNPIQNDINNIKAQIDEIFNSINKPIAIIEAQLSLMKNILMKIEEMPHGTVQAI